MSQINQDTAIGSEITLHRFVIVLFLTFIVISCSFSIAAIIIDPRGLFNTGKFPIVTWDSRRQKMDLFEKFNAVKPVESIILGSSRAMKTSPTEIANTTGLRTFNFCVDSARVEDYLALYRWVAHKSVNLKYIFIGLDIEAFHNNDTLDQRLSSNAPLMRELLDTSKITHRNSFFDSLKVVGTVLSFPYLMDMITSLRLQFLGTEQKLRLDEDGFLHYVALEQERGRGSYDLQAKIETSREEYRRRFEGMTGISVVRKSKLDQLLREAQTDNVRVVIWITPVHPVVADYLSQETQYDRLLSDVREMVTQMEATGKIQVFDFSDPISFSANRDGWYDGGHLDERNQSLITEKVLKAISNDAV